jgi:hypothetical protein
MALARSSFEVRELRRYPSPSQGQCVAEQHCSSVEDC